MLVSGGVFSKQLFLTGLWLRYHPSYSLFGTPVTKFEKCSFPKVNVVLVENPASLGPAEQDNSGMWTVHYTNMFLRAPNVEKSWVPLTPPIQQACSLSSLLSSLHEAYSSLIRDTKLCKAVLPFMTLGYFLGRFMIYYRFRFRV